MAVIEAISTTYMEAATTTVIQFGEGGDLLPTDYQHLQIRISGKTVGTTYNDRIVVNFAYGATPTFVTGTAYSYHYMMGHLGTTSAYAVTGASGINFYYLNPSLSTYDVANYSTHIIDILDYQNGSKNTTATMIMGDAPAHTSVAGACFSSGMMDDVRAVTAVKLSSVYAYWSRGTEVSLYGIKSS